jgi:hypothetical protein
MALKHSWEAAQITPNTQMQGVEWQNLESLGLILSFNGPINSLYKKNAQKMDVSALCTDSLSNSHPFGIWKPKGLGGWTLP